MRILISGLLPTTPYAIQVRSVGVEGQKSEFSQIVDFTTIGSELIPKAPANFTAAFSSDSISFSWDRVTETIADKEVVIGSYMVELTIGGVVKNIIAPQQDIARPFLNLTYEQVRALYPTGAVSSISARVRAYNFKDEPGAWSNTSSATRAVPAAPTALSGVQSGLGVQLDWVASTTPGVTSYRIYRKTASTAYSMVGSTLADVNRFFHQDTSSVALTFTVRAFDKWGTESGNSNEVTVTQASQGGGDVDPPAVPTWGANTITANANGIGARASLNWSITPVTADLAGFRVHYALASGNDWGSVVFGPDDRSGTIELQQAYTSYKFTITAFDSSANESAASAVSTPSVPGNTAPATPTGLAFVADRSALRFTWNANTEADLAGYEVQFATNGSFTSPITFKTGTSNVLNVSGLNPATKYYARVRAVDNGGLTSAFTAGLEAETLGQLTPGDIGAPTTGDLNNLTTVVNSKTRLKYGSSAPTSSTPGVPGDIFWVKSGDLIIEQWLNTAGTDSSSGNTWTKQELTNATIANLSVGKLTSGIINSAEVTISSTGQIKSDNYSAGTAGWRLNATGLELNDANSVVKAEAIKAGTLGGSSGSGVINVAAGTSFRLNGGHIRSNTYTYPGQSGSVYVYNAAATAGFYLGDDGLVIAQGAVKASTLTSGDISAAVINITGTGAIQTAGYNGTSGFKLSASGLDIPDGSLNASKVNVQNPVNLLDGIASTFEIADGTTWAAVEDASITAKSKFEASAANRVQGTNYLEVVKTTTTPRQVQLSWNTAFGTADFRVPQTGIYIISGWVYAPASGTLELGHGATFYPAKLVSNDSTTIPANSWVRVYAATTSLAEGSTVSWRVRFPGSTGTWRIDGMQVEPRSAGNISNKPSPYAVPGITTIDAGMIKTGSLRSTATLTVQGNTMPMWSIGMDGSALFGNATLRGDVVVGSAGDLTNEVVPPEESYIRSYSYQQGVTGWRVSSKGDAEFNSITVGPKALNGEAIADGTIRGTALDVDFILASDIKVSKDEAGGGGSISATGDMGEEVLLDTDGFHVYGAYRVRISNRSRTTTTVTLTTGEAHGFTAGSKLYVSGVGDQFDGTFTIASVPTATTLTYEFSGTSVGSAVAPQGAIAMSHSSTLQRPVLVDFPTDGTNPNIISGSLTSDYITVNSGISLRGDSVLETGGSFNIAGNIVAPRNKPIVTATYNETYFSQSINSYGACIGHNGNIFVLQNNSSSDSIDEYSLQGVFLGTRVNVWDRTMSETRRNIRGIIYVNGAYRVLVNTTSTVNNMQFYNDQVITYNTSFAVLSTETINSGSTLSSIPYRGAVIGMDYISGGGLYVYHAANQTRYRTLAFTTTGVSTIGSVTNLMGTSANAVTNPALVVRGTGQLGYGGEFVILKDRSSAGENLNYSVSTGLGVARTLGLGWQHGSAVVSMGGYIKDGYFYGLSSGGLRQYQNAESFWSGTTMTKPMWIGYSWASSSYETDLSPRIFYEMKKRSAMKITIGNIPISAVPNTPTEARIYVASNTTAQPALTPTVNTLWKRRATLYGSEIATVITPDSAPAGAQPRVTPGGNNFPASTELGIIQSTDGSSWWKGDGNAKFRNLDPNQINMTGSNIYGPEGTDLFLRAKAGGGVYLFHNGTSSSSAGLTASGNFNVNILNVTGTVTGATSFNSSITTAGAANIGGSAIVTGDVRCTGLFDTSTTGNGTTGASYNNNGRVIRTTSSQRFKRNIEAMDIEVAKTALELEAVTFQWNEDMDMGERRVPGFIAEQAHEAGMGLWVTYENDDEEGRPGGFRYSELTAAHNMLVKDLYAEKDALEARIEALEALVASLL